MKIPLSKLKAMLLFFASNTNPALLGKVKLMKLFYFCDFMNIKKYGAPITFDNYVHLEHGPIPSTIMNLVSLIAAIIASVVVSFYLFKQNKQEHEYRIIRKALSNDEKRILDEIKKDKLPVVLPMGRGKDKKTYNAQFYRASVINKTRIL